jgi:hypothetical protein
MIDFAATSDPELRELLSSHPRIGEVKAGASPGIEFRVGDWNRQVLTGIPDLPIAGLVELMDNNPMVCADQMSVPDPLSTLGLIALGPLAWAGLILEAPTLITSFEGDPSLLEAFLKTAGWMDGATLHAEVKNLGSVLAATAMAIISTPRIWTDIDELYDERYGRSFFVRRDEASEWDPGLVSNQSHAVYRLRYTPGEERSLLTIQVLADKNGKCGRAQLVHAMNVMAGFEESLGIA